MKSFSVSSIIQIWKNVIILWVDTERATMRTRRAVYLICWKINVVLKLITKNVRISASHRESSTKIVPLWARKILYSENEVLMYRNYAWYIQWLFMQMGLLYAFVCAQRKESRPNLVIIFLNVGQNAFTLCLDSDNTRTHNVTCIPFVV